MQYYHFLMYCYDKMKFITNVRRDCLYPEEYIQFLTHFHGDRDYFECHEILEDYWKKIEPRNKQSIWVGLILLAVSQYHHRRGNFSGAQKTIEKAINIFQHQGHLVSKLGLNEKALIDILKNRLQSIEKGRKYISFDLPIIDPHLMNLCEIACARNGFVWGKESDLNNIHLIHRHQLRDRTNVIKERNRAIKAKRDSENN
jgi:uncharacterized protein